jgi:hypothetical protein
MLIRRAWWQFDCPSGEAVPRWQPRTCPAPARTVERPAAPKPARASVPHGLGGTIAVTVRLDPTRYERLKMYGVRRRRTNQELLVEAIDAFLDDREGEGRGPN